jgi:hypothetical protein
VRRTVFIVTLGAVVLSLSGCARVAEPQAKPPPRLPEKDTQAIPTEPKVPEEPPPLIAPPPAYGNKVVMAEGPATSEIY